MRHKLYDVFKHPAPFAGQKWAVQMQTGLVCFRTKKKAIDWAQACKENDAERIQKAIEEDIFTGADMLAD